MVLNTTANKAAYPDSIITLAETAPDALVLNSLVATKGPVISGDAPSGPARVRLRRRGREHRQGRSADC